MTDYPDGYSERFERDPWPHYGDPRDGTYGQQPIIDGTNVRPDVLTDRATLVALRAWVLQERDAALRITIGNGAASSLQFAIAMSDVAAVLWACIAKLPPDPIKILGESTRPRRRPSPVPRLSRNMLPSMIEVDDATDPGIRAVNGGPPHY
jgi:hypothetical protein